MPSTSVWHSIWGETRSDRGARHSRHSTAALNRILTTRPACNGDGVRTSKTVSGGTTQYALDLAATLPVVISDTDAVYLYGLDIIAQQQLERLYYMHDGLGSVRQLLDTAGDLETNYAYDPFGVPVGLAPSSCPPPSRGRRTQLVSLSLPSLEGRGSRGG